MTDPEDTLRDLLADAVRNLARRQRLTAVETGRSGIRRWEVVRDEAGVLRGRALPDVSLDDLDEAAADLDDLAVLVATAPDDRRAAHAFARLKSAYPDALSISAPEAGLADALRRAVADDPLTEAYELVTGSRGSGGRYLLSSRPLFPAGARRGDTVEFGIRCLTGSAVFAVVARAPGRERPRLVSVESARLAPGTYPVKAELRRPGVVRFRGLPEPLSKVDRSWNALVGTLPDRFPADPHLVCAIEVSGSDFRVAARLHRLTAVIKAAAEVTTGLRTTIVPYGAHSFGLDASEQPLAALAVRDSADEALSAVSRLHAQGPLEPGYPSAARLECALHEALARLEPAGETNTALLTIGGRPAHPARVDRTGILPCPYHRDWADLLSRFPGHALVAVRDANADRAELIWHRLGRDLLTDLDSMDVLDVLAALDLGTADLRPSFPLVERV
ncbi:hypothetical protein [Actinoallomurus iriomotensis]|uniref:Uncharacterized protein n=1 Tax=Actinoallomurus iriomotensis TaxID=478107 RepID=A0A9W6RXI2_9ACTN|nr:hypothetical protein [Actinoallomurus iriomotensis]GLY83324.1 hypothetical protein Airi02_012540 [Actinoallomurus iriomotensis]